MIDVRMTPRRRTSARHSCWSRSCHDPMFVHASPD
jgi:hypothetical protein